MLFRSDAIFHKTSQMFCFVGLLYLFIFKVVTTERRKQRGKKEAKQALTWKSPRGEGPGKRWGRWVEVWGPCTRRDPLAVLPALPSGVGLLAVPSLQTLAVCQGRKPPGFPATVTQTPQASRLRPESSHEVSSKRSSGSRYLPLRHVAPNLGLVGRAELVCLSGVVLSH